MKHIILSGEIESMSSPQVTQSTMVKRAQWLRNSFKWEKH